MGAKLPVHGFVLAGGKSTRMGKDKATRLLCGRQMIEIALESLRSFCTQVWIAGNRDDLARYADIVPERRENAGPAAGVEAGLRASILNWTLFVPVDVPLMPAPIVRAWAEQIVQEEKSVCASYLAGDGQPQPAFCMLRKDCLTAWTALLDGGERRLEVLLRGLATSGTDEVLVVEMEGLAREIGFRAQDIQLWLSNVNTPEDLARAELALDRDGLRVHDRRTI